MADDIFSGSAKRFKEFQFLAGGRRFRKPQPVETTAQRVALARTVKGGDPGHVSAEKRRLNREIAANPFVASLIFPPGFETVSSVSGRAENLYKKAGSNDLTAAEIAELQRSYIFATEHGRFNELINRRKSIVAQREAVEQARKRAPGRTQTILTLR